MYNVASVFLLSFKTSPPSLHGLVALAVLGTINNDQALVQATAVEILRIIGNKVCECFKYINVWHIYVCAFYTFGYVSVTYMHGMYTLLMLFRMGLKCCHLAAFFLYAGIEVHTFFFAG